MARRGTLSSVADEPEPWLDVRPYRSGSTFDGNRFLADLHFGESK
jgi:hypothetical protein